MGAGKGPNMTEIENDMLQRVGGSPSVVSAFDILDLLASAPGPVSMTDIVRGLDLPKSSVFRLLRTLESLDAVRRNEQDKRYSLGRKFDGYSRALPTPSVVERFLEDAGPVLRPLDETTQLGVLAGLNVTFVACIDSTKPVRLVSFVGRTLPAHASATGKAILAFGPEEQIEAVIAAGLPALTEATITDPDAFRAEMQQIRERGYATESEESTSNLSCLAAPVWGASSEVIAAITICVPRATLPEHRVELMRRAVLEASRRISTDERSRAEAV